jgi:hypothetical protein
VLPGYGGKNAKPSDDGFATVVGGIAAMRSSRTFTPLYRRFDTTLTGKPLLGEIPHGRR